MSRFERVRAAVGRFLLPGRRELGWLLLALGLTMSGWAFLEIAEEVGEGAAGV